jgi:hypothetical protein
VGTDNLLGDVRKTPYEEGIRRTVAAARAALTRLSG